VTDLDRRSLAEVLVILRDIRRIIEREIHHGRVVHVDLQDQLVLLLVGSGLLLLLCGGRCHCRQQCGHEHRYESSRGAASFSNPHHSSLP